MNANRVVAWGSIGVVTIAVITGLLLAGSPAEQRLLRLDTQRVEDLSRLARAVESYWQANDVLPSDLNDLVDGRRLSRLPVDPATDAPYEYEVTKPRAYQLCATFSRPSAAEASADFWFHAAGWQCFSFDLPAGEQAAPGVR